MPPPPKATRPSPERGEEATISRVLLLLGLSPSRTLTHSYDDTYTIYDFPEVCVHLVGHTDDDGDDERGHSSRVRANVRRYRTHVLESGPSPASGLTAAGHLDLDLDSARGPSRKEAADASGRRTRMVPIIFTFQLDNWPLFLLSFSSLLSRFFCLGFFFPSQNAR